jgi:hypothetical protein
VAGIGAGVWRPEHGNGEIASDVESPWSIPWLQMMWTTKRIFWYPWMVAEWSVAAGRRRGWCGGGSLCRVHSEKKLRMVGGGGAIGGRRLGFLRRVGGRI